MRSKNIQNWQRKYHSAVCRVVHDIAELGTGIVGERIYLMGLMEFGHYQVFTGLVKKLVKVDH